MQKTLNSSSKKKLRALNPHISFNRLLVYNLKHNVSIRDFMHASSYCTCKKTKRKDLNATDSQYFVCWMGAGHRNSKGN